MDSYIGQILQVGFTFAPRGWAFCNGALLPIRQSTALFSLLGTKFGGDGVTTFGLPNLQGTIPIGAGQAPGLSPYQLGKMVGSPTVTLSSLQMPPHVHALAVSGATNAKTASPGPTTVLGATFARGTSGVPFYGTQADINAHPPAVSMLANAVQSAGADQPHNNMAPYLCVNYIIALEGIFPERP